MKLTIIWMAFVLCQSRLIWAHHHPHPRLLIPQSCLANYIILGRNGSNFIVVVKWKSGWRLVCLSRFCGGDFNNCYWNCFNWTWNTFLPLFVLDEGIYVQKTNLSLIFFTLTIWMKFFSYISFYRNFLHDLPFCQNGNEPYINLDLKFIWMRRGGVRVL